MAEYAVLVGVSMITEAILGFLIDFVVTLLAGIINFATAPASGTFSIPSPLFFIVEVMVTASTAIYPIIAGWFLWRQVWGK